MKFENDDVTRIYTTWDTRKGVMKQKPAQDISFNNI